jgi:hypothetical protein
LSILLRESPDDHTVTSDIRHEPISILRKSYDRRPRAERRDKVLVSTVKFPWGLEARLLNISSTGLLFESGTRIAPGSCQRLTLSGPEIELEVPASFVRSEVALVNGLGVKYHIAVMFAAPVELADSVVSAAEASTPRTLSHLLAQVAAELSRDTGADRRPLLERAIRRVTGACEVRIERGGVDRAATESVVEFAMASRMEPALKLRAAFAPGQKLASNDLRLVGAAARVAVIVLDCEGLR